MRRAVNCGTALTISITINEKFNWMAYIVNVETVIHRAAEESSLCALHNDARWLNTTNPTFFSLC